jgi:hypothetical protein
MLPDNPIVDVGFVSPDGSMVMVGGIRGLEYGFVAVSLKDGTRKAICAALCVARWSGDGAYLYVTMNPTPSQARPTLVFSIPKGASLPALPAQGLGPQAAQESPGLGIEKIFQDWPAPGPDPQTYAFVKSEFAGNLFRIPLH